MNRTKMVFPLILALILMPMSVLAQEKSGIRFACPAGGECGNETGCSLPLRSGQAWSTASPHGHERRDESRS